MSADFITWRDSTGTLKKLEQEPGDVPDTVRPRHGLPPGVVLNIANAASQLSAIATTLTSMAGSVDGLEGLATATNTALTALQGYVDGLEGLAGTTNTGLTALQGYVDGLEGLASTTNTALTTLQGYTDGLETLIGATNTALTTLQGYVDGLEGFTDGLETLITATNTALTTLQGYTDTLEALTSALNPSTAGTPFQKSAGTSAVQLDSVTTTTGCWIKNISTGTQAVYVGRSGVLSSTGYQLAIGEERFFPCRNTNEWYVLGSAASSNSSVLPI